MANAGGRADNVVDAASSTSSAVKAFVIVIAAVLIVLAATGGIKLEFFAGTVSTGPPPAVRDAVAIADAAGSTDGDEAAGSVYELLDVATKAGTARGALLIRQQLPALAARIDAAAPIAHERLLGVDLRTSVGRKCRVAVLRLIAQEQWLFRTFDDEVARNRSTSTAVDRFTARWQALGRWWAAQVTACSAGAGPGERADVEGAMHSL